MFLTLTHPVNGYQFRLNIHHIEQYAKSWFGPLVIVVTIRGEHIHVLETLEQIEAQLAAMR